jgi:hypothetical protein
VKLVPLLFVTVMLFAGGGFSSCKYTPVAPDTTKKKCDTCCDTCHKMDTTKHGCDTCNIDKDSTAHAFVWTELINKIPGETNLTGVWVFGPKDIYIVANSLWHYNGFSFSVVPAFDRTFNNVTMNGALNGHNIFAFSNIDFWMVYGSVTYHTSDGKYFDDFRVGSASACWGSSPNDVFIVGNGGHIAHYDGNKFTQMSSSTTKDLHSVWGTSSNDVWAGGLNRSNGVSVLLHYNGNIWSEIDLTNLGKFGCAGCDGISSVWACDSSTHHFAYVGGSYFYHNRDNGIWTNDSDKVENKFSDGSYAGLSIIKGNNTNDILTVSDWGFASHWNGKTWKRYDVLYNPQNSSYITNSMDFHENTAAIVGLKGGQSWIAIGQRK